MGSLPLWQEWLTATLWVRHLREVTIQFPGKRVGQVDSLVSCSLERAAHRQPGSSGSQGLAGNRARCEGVFARIISIYETRKTLTQVKSG